MRGKLKHSLSRRCPTCAHILQLRTLSENRMVKGETVVITSDIICCSSRSCEYEETVPNKKREGKHLEAVATPE